MKHASALLILAACGTRADQPPVPQSATTSVPAPIEPAVMPAADPIVKGVPHGGDVLEVAVTEQGDAAITTDSLNSVRLWPALDGTRQPVLINFASEAVQLGITHSGRDLVALFLDRGGAITVLRLGRDGSARGRVQIGDDDATFDEMVVSGEHVFARTSEHIIEWYGLDGTLRGRLEPAPGQRVIDLAGRNGQVAAIVQDTTKAYLRWIAIPAFAGGQLTWEAPLDLPVIPREDLFAIAPNRRRIAFVDAAFSLHVIDMGVVPLPVLGPKMFPNESHRDLGFLDDDTVAGVGFNVMWWIAHKDQSAPSDPWEVVDVPTTGLVTPSLNSSSPSAAFANGMIVSSNSGSLALVKPKEVRYLGWRIAGIGHFHPTATNTLVLGQSGARYTWLDENLTAVRSIDLNKEKPPASSWAYGQPLGAHHIIAQSYFNDDTSSFEIIDVEDPTKRVALMTRKKRVDQYFPSEDMIGIKLGNKLHRFKIDLATTTATELLPAITINDYSLMMTRVFDPEKTGGLLAVSTSWPNEYSEHAALTYYRLGKNGKVVTERVRKWEPTILRIDDNGQMIVIARDPDARIRVLANGEIVREVKRTLITPPVSVNRDATRFAGREGANEIVVFDDQGNDVWRRTMWGTSNLTFSPSGKRVMVTAVGGVVALDAETGEPITKECGFEFGLHDTPADFGPHGFASVCEDSIIE